MRSLLLAGGLVAALAMPAIANAQATRCERDNSTNRAAGTIVGAGIGALLGSAIAGRHDSTAGVIVGGVAGGVAGNQIAKGANQPCPPGYRDYYEQPTSAPAPGPTTFWNGAPAGPRERIAYMESRIRTGVDNGTLSRREADQAYQDLTDIRRMERNLRRRDNGLTGPDRDYIQTRLDEVGRNIRWAERADAGYNRPYDRPYDQPYNR